jgi:hypothetical protein
MKKKNVNRAFLQRTIEVLETMFDEFDTADADYDAGLLKTAFTTLINEGYMTVRLKGFGIRDLVEEVLGEQASEDLLDRSETFDNLLDTYTGEPSDEDMQEAYHHLGKIMGSLRKKMDSLKKRKSAEATLWKNA